MMSYNVNVNQEAPDTVADESYWLGYCAEPTLIWIQM